jgi:hypothetical protein
MSVWFVIPSKRPLAEANACIDAWLGQGYEVAVLREDADGRTCADFQGVVEQYIGWARSVNLLVNACMAAHSDAEWFVTGGDDYYPDPTKTAAEIAAECGEYFHTLETLKGRRSTPTFGVMQPTGDRWGEARCLKCMGVSSMSILCDACGGTGRQATIDRIAGSPWMGREFCRRMYHGSGPMYNGYYHNFADEELQNVAQKLGVFWQRRDLLQEHRHWARPRGDWRDAPEWAKKINDPRLSDWDRSKALFAARKAGGFPGHEPLEA